MRPAQPLKVWTATILGQPYSMKNRRQIIVDKTTGKRRSIKSKEALAYAETFNLQMQFYRLPPDDLILGPVRVTIRIWYKSESPDLDEALILDLLQGTVYKNDNKVVEKHVFKECPPDKTNPRAEITVEELPPRER